MNVVIVTGRITKDPEVRYTSSQMAVCTVTLAIDRPTKDKVTDFPRVVVFGKQAESLATYTKKGSMIGVVGSIQTGSYEKNGEKVFTTDIVANRVEFLSWSDEKPEKKREAKKEEKQEVFESFAALDEDVPF
jgi:single-strand DNA-binding protein